MSSEKETLEGYRLLREGAGVCQLADIVFIEVTGEDRQAWLQGQLTCDLRDLTVGGSRRFCMCTPTGQLLAFGTLWALADRFIMWVPRQSLADVLRRFEEMVILEDVAARPLEGRSIVSIQGPLASAFLQERRDLPPLDAVEIGGLSVLRSDRTGLVGWDLIGRESEISQIIKGLSSISEEAFEIARIEAGHPKFGQDMKQKTLPPELGPAFVESHISYTKGCYTGQEVIMRIYSRGHTNKTWMGMLGDGQAAVGQPILVGDKEVGSVTSSAVSPELGPIAAGYVRNEHALEGIQIAFASGTTGELRQMPLLRLH